jgi:hypothetical protein
VDAGANPNVQCNGKTAYDQYSQLYKKSAIQNQNAIAKELLKYMALDTKISNPETKLSDLSIDELAEILKRKLDNAKNF